jgi:hypothetical protein
MVLTKINRREFIKLFAATLIVSATPIKPLQKILHSTHCNLLDELNAITLRTIKPRIIDDILFSSNPLFNYLKSNPNKNILTI